MLRVQRDWRISKRPKNRAKVIGAISQVCLASRCDCNVHGQTTDFVQTSGVQHSQVGRDQFVFHFCRTSLVPPKIGSQSPRKGLYLFIGRVLISAVSSWAFALSWPLQKGRTVK